ncbi:uncharacterized protein [Littorina saxatilis]|uniref:uncharacterized protein isoform X2 n=1 Tax=Littorina saxatilis TaxID=31220 RepID=UPI0038B63CC0
MLVDAKLWKISGTLKNGQEIQAQTGVINQTYCTLVSTAVQTLTEDFSSKDVAQVLWRSNTRDLTSSIGPTSSVSQESKTGATDSIDYHKTKVVILVVVAVVVVLIVMVVLVLVFKLWASVKKIKNRSSSTGITRTEPRPAHPRMYPALFNKDLYGGSNVSLMISNDMYVEGPWNAPRDVSRARRPLPAPPGGSNMTLTDRAGDGCSSSVCEKEGDYAEINSLLGDSKQGACGGQNTYTGVDEVRKQKTEKPTEKGKDDALH